MVHFFPSYKSVLTKLIFLVYLFFFLRGKMPFTCEDYRRNYGHMNKKSPCIPILNVIWRGFEQWLALFTPYLISSFAYIDTSMGVIIIGEKKVEM